MIFLTTPDSLLKVQLSANVVASQMPFTVHYIDDSACPGPSCCGVDGASDGTTNNTTVINMLTGPEIQHTRKIQFISLYNSDSAIAAVTITLNNGTDRIIYKCLEFHPGYLITYNHDTGWKVQNQNGAVQSGSQGPAGPPGLSSLLYLTNN